MTVIGDCRKKLSTAEGEVTIYSLRELEKQGVISDLKKKPYSIRVLIESLLRQKDGRLITDDDVKKVASWNAKDNGDIDIPFIPARVLLQDLTGGAAVVDLASMRAAVADVGKDPSVINPLVPVDLVIDHSIQVDVAGCPEAQERNEEIEFARNKERYALFKWAQNSFKNFRAVPPGKGLDRNIFRSS